MVSVAKCTVSVAQMHGIGGKMYVFKTPWQNVWYLCHFCMTIVYPDPRLSLEARNVKDETGRRGRGPPARGHPALDAATIDTSVCEENTPPEKKTLGERSLQSAKSGAGEQFLPLDCRPKARLK